MKYTYIIFIGMSSVGLLFPFHIHADQNTDLIMKGVPATLLPNSQNPDVLLKSLIDKISSDALHHDTTSTDNLKETHSNQKPDTKQEGQHPASQDPEEIAALQKKLYEFDIHQRVLDDESSKEKKKQKALTQSLTNQSTRLKNIDSSVAQIEGSDLKSDSKFCKADFSSAIQQAVTAVDHVAEVSPKISGILKKYYNKDSDRVKDLLLTIKSLEESQNTSKPASSSSEPKKLSKEELEKKLAQKKNNFYDKLKQFLKDSYDEQDTQNAVQHALSLAVNESIRGFRKDAQASYKALQSNTQALYTDCMNILNGKSTGLPKQIPFHMKLRALANLVLNSGSPNLDINTFSSQYGNLEHSYIETCRQINTDSEPKLAAIKKSLEDAKKALREPDPIKKLEGLEKITHQFDSKLYAYLNTTVPNITAHCEKIASENDAAEAGLIAIDSIAQLSAPNNAMRSAGGGRGGIGGGQRQGGFGGAPSSGASSQMPMSHS